MIIFINDIPVKILKPGEKPDPGLYNHTIDAASEAITQAKLIHHVWVDNAEVQHFDILLGFLNLKVPTNLITLLVSVKDYSAIKEYLRSKFKVVKAAGGLVRKKRKISDDLPPEKVGPPERKKRKERKIQANCGA